MQRDELDLADAGYPVALDGDMNVPRFNHRRHGAPARRPERNELKTLLPTGKDGGRDVWRVNACVDNDQDVAGAAQRLNLPGVHCVRAEIAGDCAKGGGIPGKCERCDCRTVHVVTPHQRCCENLRERGVAPTAADEDTPVGEEGIDDRLRRCSNRRGESLPRVGYGARAFGDLPIDSGSEIHAWLRGFYTCM